MREPQGTPASLRPKDANIPRLAFSTEELATSLGVSTTHLRKMNPPHAWLGQRKLHPIDEVKEWLREHMAQPAEDQSDEGA